MLTRKASKSFVGESNSSNLVSTIAFHQILRWNQLRHDPIKNTEEREMTAELRRKQDRIQKVLVGGCNFELG